MEKQKEHNISDVCPIHKLEIFKFFFRCMVGKHDEQGDTAAELLRANQLLKGEVGHSRTFWRT